MAKDSQHLKLATLPTYIFIDTSNIRAACLKTLGLYLNFANLMDYFKHKYPKLQDVRYYEGVAKDSPSKQLEFKKLEEVGYTICSLARKAYHILPTYKHITCSNCGEEIYAQISSSNVQLKSNVDVYLASELLKRAFLAKEPTHIMLVSCDGDYVETLKIAAENENIHLTVLAVPPTKDLNKNALSSRLKDLYREIPIPRYQLSNIEQIRNYIEK